LQQFIELLLTERRLKQLVKHNTGKASSFGVKEAQTYIFFLKIIPLPGIWQKGPFSKNHRCPYRMAAQIQHSFDPIVPSSA
jgi:hypothetical protein